jgi:hypothetical protein
MWRHREKKVTSKPRKEVSEETMLPTPWSLRHPTSIIVRKLISVVVQEKEYTTLCFKQPYYQPLVVNPKAAVPYPEPC